MADEKSKRAALSCVTYQTDVGFETRAGYGDDLVRSQFAREIEVARTLADDWKRLSLEKGFTEIG